LYRGRVGACWAAPWDFVGASWEDIKKAQNLGYKIPAEFLEDLRKASGREK